MLSIKGLDISGLVVSEKPFTANEIQQLSTTCDNRITNALLTSDDLRKINSSSIEMIIPSVCDGKTTITSKKSIFFHLKSVFILIIFHYG